MEIVHLENGQQGSRRATTRETAGSSGQYSYSRRRESRFARSWCSRNCGTAARVPWKGMPIPFRMKEGAPECLPLSASTWTYLRVGAGLRLGGGADGGRIERIFARHHRKLKGPFGIPLGVSTDTIFYFLLFGAFLVESGGAKLFPGLALRLTGRKRGGSANPTLTTGAAF
jgi:hypothetical protein